jgi:hypothetical protein
MTQSLSFGNTTNLLVPQGGTTHCVKTSFTASATPENLSFQQFSLDNFNFNPQAGYFDNTQGTQPLVVTVQGLGFTFSIPAGSLQAVNFPSPANITLNVTGAGPVTIYWLDYPVLVQPPNGAASSVTVANSPLPVSVVAGSVQITGDNPTDKSVTDTVAATSSPLIAANPVRSSIEVQAPQTTGIWINKAGGVAGPNLTGCIFLPAGAIYESGVVVNRNAWTYWCSTAGLVIPILEV